MSLGVFWEQYGTKYTTPKETQPCNEKESNFLANTDNNYPLACYGISRYGEPKNITTKTKVKKKKKKQTIEKERK